tara:strand:- start:4523 stop:5104 length:582 start_codon:yes stop_codon:yes gene_type:complete
MKLKIENLLSLEDYDNQREEIKKDLIEHKKNRTVSIGEHIILLFENYSTIKYQVQEMLRIEKIFNKKEIQEEIDAYNPLIPDGDNLKATMLIMYPDVDERKVMLSKLHDVENHIWISCGSKKITAFADEDLERSTDNKTSAVHFLRFQLDQDDMTAFLSNKEICLGVDHIEYKKEIVLGPEIQSSLAKDLSNN